MGRVFASYRRNDDPGRVGRVIDRLERDKRVRRGGVFKDVDKIAPGTDYETAIARALERAQVVLVFIGPRWAGGDVVGQRRIDEADDDVRREVVYALAKNAHVIPVLLAGTALPPREELPDNVAAPATRQYVRIDDDTFEDGIRRLLAAIPPARKRHRAVVPGIGLCCLTAIGVSAWRIQSCPGTTEAPPPEHLVPAIRSSTHERSATVLPGSPPAFARFCAFDPKATQRIQKIAPTCYPTIPQCEAHANNRPCRDVDALWCYVTWTNQPDDTEAIDWWRAPNQSRCENVRRARLGALEPLVVSDRCYDVQSAR